MFEFFGVERRLYCVRVTRNRIRAASAWPFCFFVISEAVKYVASSEAAMCRLMSSSSAKCAPGMSKLVALLSLSLIT